MIVVIPINRPAEAILIVFARRLSTCVLDDLRVQFIRVCPGLIKFSQVLNECDAAPELLCRRSKFNALFSILLTE